MKVIIINGSPRKDGNTSIAVGELDKVFKAEGIETEEMAGIMRDISCDYLQGYYFSRPVPMAELPSKTVMVTPSEALPMVCTAPGVSMKSAPP